MVIDSSALIAILLKEAEAVQFLTLISESPESVMSAATLLEASIVIESRRGIEGARDLDLLIYRAGIEIIPFDADQAESARLAWRRFGKGRHKAGLNFGDCFAYALAKEMGVSLLYKGKDFAATDLVQ